MPYIPKSQADRESTATALRQAALAFAAELDFNASVGAEQDLYAAAIAFCKAVAKPDGN